MLYLVRFSSFALVAVAVLVVGMVDARSIEHSAHSCIPLRNIKVSRSETVDSDQLICSLEDGQLLYVNLSEYVNEAGDALDLMKLNQDLASSLGVNRLNVADLDRLKEHMVVAALKDMSHSDLIEKRNKQPSMPFRIGK